MPGGDKIGRRRLDTHFIGFQKLGADFKYKQGDKTCWEGVKIDLQLWGFPRDRVTL